MKRRTALGIMAALQIGVSSRRASAASQAEVLTAAEFTDEQNASHHLSELTRPLLLVNLWASWCPGCLEELPTIRTMAAQLGSDALDVVLVSHEMNWRGDLAFARQASLPFRHWKLSALTPDRTVISAFRMEDDRFGLPQSLVFAGRNRLLVASHLGSHNWAAPDQLRLARAWLGASESSGG